MIITMGSKRVSSGAAAGLTAAVLFLSALPAAASESTASPPPPRAAPAKPTKPAPHRGSKFSNKATLYFEAVWGVDKLKVTRVASGNLIRFNYRVTDPAQAAALVDRNADPVLYAPRARAMLKVPKMEKIGAFRQVAALKAGQEYWIAFSNKGNLVRPGDHVNVVVGKFHADGLVVE